MKQTGRVLHKVTMILLLGFSSASLALDESDIDLSAGYGVRYAGLGGVSVEYHLDERYSVFGSVGAVDGKYSMNAGAYLYLNDKDEKVPHRLLLSYGYVSRIKTIRFGYEDEVDVFTGFSVGWSFVWRNIDWSIMVSDQSAFDDRRSELEATGNYAFGGEPDDVSFSIGYVF